MLANSIKAIVATGWDQAKDAVGVSALFLNYLDKCGHLLGPGVGLLEYEQYKFE